jgi:hypothetical protein
VSRWLRAGAGLLGVLTGMGTAAETGAKHPDRLWIFLPAGLLASFAQAVGAVGAYLTRPTATALYIECDERA